MWRVLTLIAIFSGVIGFGFYLTYRHNHTPAHHVSIDVETGDLAKAQALLNAGEPYEALEIVAPYLSDDEDILDEEWVNLAITAYETIGDPFNLSGLYQQYPDAVLKHETACVTLAGFNLHVGNLDSFRVFREPWVGRETLVARWVLLDAQRFLYDNDVEAAERLLTAHRFSGRDEADRLIRLAWVQARSDVMKAWKTLEEAHEVAPDYPQVHSQRGYLADKTGSSGVAQTEFMAALQMEPRNPVLRDQLGEFYRRHEQYKLALQTWSGGLVRPSADILWLKTLFWSRVVFPAQVDWKTLEVPAGRNSRLVSYVMQLPEGVFWDENTFREVKEGGKYLHSRQETFWLRLLQLLKEGQEKPALELLTQSPFRGKTWHPELETELQRVLNYRATGHLAYQVTPSQKGEQTHDYEPAFAPMATRHQFFNRLNEAASQQAQDLPADLQALLKSPEVFAAVFMSAGWVEAALQLHNTAVISETMPTWLSYGITECLRENRSLEAALAFAKAQPRNPSLSLLIGQLLVMSGSPDAGLEVLQGLVTSSDSDVAFHASLQVVNLHIAAGQYDKAQGMLDNYKPLYDSVLGKEIMARIAYLKGNIDLADRLYGALEKQSTEALSYLARRAFEQGEWKRAQELTEELLMTYPSNPVLHENLKRILYAEKQAAKRRR